MAHEPQHTTSETASEAECVAHVLSRLPDGAKPGTADFDEPVCDALKTDWRNAHTIWVDVTCAYVTNM